MVTKLISVSRIKQTSLTSKDHESPIPRISQLTFLFHNIIDNFSTTANLIGFYTSAGAKVCQDFISIQKNSRTNILKILIWFEIEKVKINFLLKRISNRCNSCTSCSSCKEY